jgi:hypothetical protein
VAWATLGHEGRMADGVVVVWQWQFLCNTLSLMEGATRNYDIRRGMIKGRLGCAGPRAGQREAAARCCVGVVDCWHGEGGRASWLHGPKWLRNLGKHFELFEWKIESDFEWFLAKKGFRNILKCSQDFS